SLISTENDHRGDKLVTLTKLVLYPDTYTISTRVTDVGSGATSEKEVSLVARAFPKGELAISDIELAYSVSTDTSQGKFAKHDYHVLPNPDAVYGLRHPILYFYSEIYNLSDDSDSTYIVQYFIEDHEQKVQKSFPTRSRQLKGTSVVEVGGLNIVSFPAGVYDLKIMVTDNADQQQASKSKRFYIFRESRVQRDQPGAPPILSSYYANFSEDQIVEEFETAKYIASDEEKRTFTSLDLTGKRAFLEQFWSKRSSMQAAPFTDARREYFLRVRAANQRFSSPQRLGWKTDQGRILILHGDPDEIERNANVSEGRGFERWNYRSGQRQMIFVFVDKHGWDEMELVHSTARGEVYDPDWERWIRVK
ncbi:GWxTD domain-containing protein, partial [bacterium]|nr:GWxTD domain-containing protein [bacterium]